MRVPRLRFTLRRMMIAVALVALLFGAAAGLWRRHLSFKRQADEYAKRMNTEFARGYRVAIARWPSDGELKMKDEHYRLKDYYKQLKLKYERAAARPWLPVESDRPPPEWPKDVPRSPPQSNRAPEQPPPRVRLAVLARRVEYS
jgi:hypothetical protein